MCVFGLSLCSALVELDRAQADRALIADSNNQEVVPWIISSTEFVPLHRRRRESGVGKDWRLFRLSKL